MAKYRAMRDALVGSHYVRAGEVFDFNGPKPAWASDVEKEPPASKVKTTEKNDKGVQTE